MCLFLKMLKKYCVLIMQEKKKKKQPLEIDFIIMSSAQIHFT